MYMRQAISVRVYTYNSVAYMCVSLSRASHLLTWYTILNSGRELRFVFLPFFYFSQCWMTLFSPRVRTLSLSFLIICLSPFFVLPNELLPWNIANQLFLRCSSWGHTFELSIIISDTSHAYIFASQTFLFFFTLAFHKNLAGAKSRELLNVSPSKATPGPTD